MVRVALTLVLFAVVLFPAGLAGRVQKPDFGPAVRNYLLGLEEEFKELDFQLRHGEISRAIHFRSRARLQILRRFVERIAMERDEDRVPELEVLTAEELGALGLSSRPIPGDIQAGMRLGDHWDVIAIEPGRPQFLFSSASRPRQPSPERNASIYARSLKLWSLKVRLRPLLRL